MTLDRKKLGQDIRDHRKACGKTIEKVVAEIGDDRISVKTCVRIEQGDPSGEILLYQKKNSEWSSMRWAWILSSILQMKTSLLNDAPEMVCRSTKNTN